MQVEVTTDGNVDGTQELIRQVTTTVTECLSRFGDRLTRVEVHLGDENAAKSGAADKRCTIEARPSGQQPVAVTHHASTVEDASRGAVHKLETLLDRRFGRQDDRKGGKTIRTAES